MMKAALALATMLCLAVGSARAQDRPEVFPQLGHFGEVLGLAISPDGAMVASSGSDNAVRIWEAATVREIRTLGQHIDALELAFSPDGHVLVVATIDGKIKLFDSASGRELRELIGHAGAVPTIAFSPDGRLLASGGDDRTIKLWDPSSGQQVGSIGGFSSALISVRFSPDGKLLAATSRDHVIKLWDVASGRELPSIKGHAVGRIAFSPDGRTLASGGNANTIKLWDVASGRELGTLRGHTDFVYVVAFSPDGRFLASSGFDGTARIWNLSNGAQVANVSDSSIPYSSPVWGTSLAFAPTEDVLFLGIATGAVRRFDATNGRELPPLSGRSPGAYVALYTPDGSTVTAGYFDGTIKLWDASSGHDPRTLGKHGGRISSLAYSKDGEILASAGDDNSIKLWDVMHAGEPRTLRGHTDIVESVAFSPDRQLLASGGSDKSIRLWDVASGRQVRTLRGHTATVNSVAFSPDGRLLASASGQSGSDGVNAANAVKLWDVASGKLVRTLIGHAKWVTAVAFSPDGAVLASAADDLTVKLWDVASGREVRTLGGFADRVTSVAFAADGKTVVAGSHDSTVKFWDVATGSEIRTFNAKNDLVSSVAFSPDQKKLVTASWTSTVRVWDLAAGKEEIEFITFTDGSSLAITPEGYYDSSSEKAEGNLNVRVGNRVFPIGAYREKFYRPDLVKLSLAGSSLKQLGFAGIDSVKVAPIVELVAMPVSVSDQKITVNLRITDGGGGIGLVRLFVNGTAVVQDNEPHAPPAAAGGSVARSYTVQLAGGANALRAVAFNADDSMQSNPAVANVELQLTPQATLHALVVGIQEFKNPNLKLSYSVADAKLFAETLRKYAAPLFKGTPDIKLLTVPAETTRDAVLQALKTFVSSVGPDDLFIFYVASHGFVDNGEYYLITSNVGSVSTDHLKSDAVNKGELTALIANIAATKKLMVIDTCHAEGLGNALQAGLLTRGLDDATALKILSRSVGTTVLAASTSTQSAMEGYQDHGLFTYVVADGLRGAADVEQSGFVSTLGLAHYVDRQVPELAEREFNQAQYPVIETNGQAFPLTKVK